jgi:hypothetical protein
MPEPVPKVFLRFGSHSEKQYVIKTAKLFDGVIVGANLLESTPGATVSFAMNILGRFKREFAIDPMTYTFGMDLRYIQSETIDRASGKPGKKKTGLKRSFAALAQRFGQPLSDVVLRENRPVKPSDFTSPLIDALSRSVLDYQATRMRSYGESDPQLKELADHLIPPSFLFAPYFYVRFEGNRTGWRAWHDLNLALAESFAGIESDMPRHSVLCIDASILSARAELLEIANGYIGTGCQACWLWISNFVEQFAGVDEIRNLVELCHRFRDAGIELYNLHGGFLSVLLSKHGMTGLSHGVGYGESKDVIPVIGVIVPTVNYHLPPVHVRAPMLDLERAFPGLHIRSAEDFKRKVCDCTVCKGILRGDLNNTHEFGDTVIKVGNTKESQTADSAKKCRFHFLLARKKEVERVSMSSLADVKKDLLDSYREYSSLPQFLALQGKAEHLRTWASAT